MSIASTTNQNQYVGNGAVDTYAYSFRILAKTDLRVVVGDLNHDETVLTVDVDYTVTGVGDESGGSIALVNSSQAWLDVDGDLLTDFDLSIRRVRPLTQATDIRNQGEFFPETHEDAFDHQIMIAQQLQNQLDRSIKLKDIDSTATLELPVAEDRASQFLAFDADGNAIAASAVSTVGVSAFMQTLLDDASAAAGLTTLGFSAFIQTLKSAASAAVARATLGFSGASGTVATANIEDLAVTKAKLAADARSLVVSTKSATYTTLDTDDVLLLNGTFTLNLIAAASRNRPYYLKNIGTGVITLDGNSAETIDGSATYTLTIQNESVILISDGSNWRVFG